MGIPDFPPRFDTDLLRPFWDAVAEGELRLPACSECGKWQWYPFEAIACHPEAHLEWKDVPRTGTVFTFTTVHRSLLPGDQEGVAPYTTALVELESMPGVRIVTMLINIEGCEPEIGMPVRLAPLSRNTFTLPTFEPADT